MYIIIAKTTKKDIYNHIQKYKADSMKKHYIKFNKHFNAKQYTKAYEIYVELIKEVGPCTIMINMMYKLIYLLQFENNITIEMLANAQMIIENMFKFDIDRYIPLIIDATINLAKNNRYKNINQLSGYLNSVNEAIAQYDKRDKTLNILFMQRFFQDIVYNVVSNNCRPAIQKLYTYINDYDMARLTYMFILACFGYIQEAKEWQKLLTTDECKQYAANIFKHIK